MTLKLTRWELLYQGRKGEMKNIVISIIMFAICVSLVIGTVLPVSDAISDTGEKIYKTVKELNDNIK